MKKNKGFTLIELIVVMLIITVFSFTGGAILTYLVQNSIFIPRQLNTQALTLDAMQIMVEGDDQAKGLRFSKAITRIRRRRVDFNNQDDQAIKYRLRNDTKRLDRKIGSGPWTITPYYQTPSEMPLDGKSNTVFTYYDDQDQAIPPSSGDPADVRRIKITLMAKTGSGLYEEAQGLSEVSTAIAVDPL